MCIRDSSGTTSPGGLEQPTFRLTAERASQLRHGDTSFDVTASLCRGNIVSRNFFNSHLFQSIVRQCLLQSVSKQCYHVPGWLEQPTFRLTAERANQLRHGDTSFDVTASLCGGNIVSRNVFNSQLFQSIVRQCLLQSVSKKWYHVPRWA